MIPQTAPASCRVAQAAVRGISLIYSVISIPVLMNKEGMI